MAAVERNLEIHAPEHLTRGERARDTLATALLWGVYLYFWLPLLSLLAWLLGFERAYDVMIRAGGLAALENELSRYLTVVAAIAAAVAGWSLVNRLRFRRRDRRGGAAGPVGDLELVRYFGVGEPQLDRLRSGRCIDIRFRDGGGDGGGGEHGRAAISVSVRR